MALSYVFRKIDLLVMLIDKGQKRKMEREKERREKVMNLKQMALI